jgi:hypothetical protein
MDVSDLLYIGLEKQIIAHLEQAFAKRLSTPNIALSDRKKLIIKQSLESIFAKLIDAKELYTERTKKLGGGGGGGNGVDEYELSSASGSESSGSESSGSEYSEGTDSVTSEDNNDDNSSLIEGGDNLSSSISCVTDFIYKNVVPILVSFDAVLPKRVFDTGSNSNSSSSNTIQPEDESSVPRYEFYLRSLQTKVRDTSRVIQEMQNVQFLLDFRCGNGDNTIPEETFSKTLEILYELDSRRMGARSIKYDLVLNMLELF